MDSADRAIWNQLNPAQQLALRRVVLAESWGTFQKTTNVSEQKRARLLRNRITIISTLALLGSSLLGYEVGKAAHTDASVPQTYRVETPSQPQAEPSKVTSPHPPAPDERTFSGSLTADHNREIYGHPWDRTDREKAADNSWQGVENIDSKLIGIGGDYKAYNSRLTRAYRHWEGLESAAYGLQWRTLWAARHTGDILGECGYMQKLGMSRAECVQMEQDEGKPKQLEPMLLKCSPDGHVMVRNAESCHTHGQTKPDTNLDDNVASTTSSD